MNNNVLDVEVSQFNNYYTKENPTTINLYDWLRNNRHKTEVEKVRSTKDKTERNKIKATLPAITPSGVFHRHDAKSLVKHSGLICIDIDLKDNQTIGNFYELKSQFCNLKNVAYCGLSVSGEGYFLIIPISNPDKHEAHFAALEKDFITWGIKIDSACKDVCRLRGCSWDADAYFNPTAEVYSKTYIKPKPQPILNYYNNSGDRVSGLVDRICSSGIVLADTYDEWIKVAFALISEFGEAAREMFDAISSQHPGYDPKETERQFNDCLNRNRSGISIGTFFYYCKMKDI